MFTASKRSNLLFIESEPVRFFARNKSRRLVRVEWSSHLCKAYMKLHTNTSLCIQQTIFELPFVFLSKRVFVQNHSYENVFQQQVPFHANLNSHRLEENGEKELRPTKKLCRVLACKCKFLTLKITHGNYLLFTSLFSMKPENNFQIKCNFH